MLNILQPLEKSADVEINQIETESDDFGESDFYDSSSDDDDFTYKDIKLNPTHPINDVFLLMLTKNCVEFTNDNKRKICKLMKFGSDWKVEEIIKYFKNCDHKEFPNLLMVIIQMNNIDSINLQNRGSFSNEIKIYEKKLKKTLIKFAKNRPMIFQISSEIEDVSKFYFNCSDSQKFKKIKNIACESKIFNDFSSFLWLFLEGKFENLFDSCFEILPNVQNSSLIYRFLRMLRQEEEDFKSLILGCFWNGSKNDIKAILNYPLHDRNNEIETEFKILGQKYSNNENEVKNFILDYCSRNIGKFIYSSQLKISTKAFDKNDFGLLCDLIDTCDFPFPENLKTKSVIHEDFNKIIKKREEFNKAINEKSENEIKQFIVLHPNLKFVYNPNNCSALHQAFDPFDKTLLHQLEDLDFQTPEYKDYCRTTSDKNNIRTARELATLKRDKNIKAASQIVTKTVLQLLCKSFIRKNNNTKETDNFYKGKISKWFENIYSILENKPHLDIAAQCSKLKIIFDFDSEEIYGIDPLRKGAEGIMYPSEKLILIGAKCLNNENESREEQIEGIISHEIDHYALELDYENASNPYFKYDEQRKKELEEIVEKTNLWKCSNLNNPNDECDDIISTVFTLYTSDRYHAELIVRVPQILTQYARNEVKLEFLEEKYRLIFDFYRKYIIPDLENFNLKNRENIRRFNKLFGKLDEIKKCNHEFSSLKDVSHLLNNHITVVKTNIPTLLLLNIMKILSAKYDDLLDAMSIFVSLKSLKHTKTFEELHEIIKESSDVNIIVNCSKAYERRFNKLTYNIKVKYTFIVSDDQSFTNVSKLLKKSIPESIVYTWNDLSLKTHDDLLKNSVKLLKDSVPLGELVVCENNSSAAVSDCPIESQESDLFVPNDELFKILVEKNAIEIHESPDDDKNDEKNFNAHFLIRRFIKCQEIEEKSGLGGKDENESKGIIGQTMKTLKNSKSIKNFFSHNKSGSEDTQKTNLKQLIRIVETNLSQDELLEDIKGQRIVLFTDSAGNGKSWATKNIANIMRQHRPRKWIAQVDLKQYIKFFKDADESTVDFSNFMIKSVLKLEIEFKSKIFTRMYKNGRVCVFFDGFDEIAPNYAEIVKKLMKSFESFGGNQLWIATRDYFKSELQEEFELKVVYRLEPFTHENGIDFMTSMLVYHDLEKKNEHMCEADIRTQIRNHSDYKAYQQIATNLNKLVCDLNSKVIGAPQFYQMIVNIYKEKGSKISAMTIFEIFKESVDIQHENWCSKQGEIRRKTNTSSLHHLLNYMTLHEFFALKGSINSEDTFPDLVYDNREWTETKIISCGLLLQRNHEFYFQHETFREFFIAHYIERILRKFKGGICVKFCNILRDVLTLSKFEIVRLFLNEYLKSEHQTIMEEILPKIGENVETLHFLLDIHKNDLINLQVMWMNYFKSLQLKSYKKLTNILFKDSRLMNEISKDINICIKFGNFPHTLLKSRDLYELINTSYLGDLNFLQHVLLNKKFEAIKVVIDTLKEKLDKNHFLEIQKSTLGSSLQVAAFSIKDLKTFEYVWKINLDLCQPIEEFTSILARKDFCENNFFVFVIRFGTGEIFKFIIEQLEERVPPEVIMNILYVLRSGKILDSFSNSLQEAMIYNTDLEFHKLLWETLQKYFEKEDIHEMITSNDYYDAAVIGDHKINYNDDFYAYSQNMMGNTKIFLVLGGAILSYKMYKIYRIFYEKLVSKFTLNHTFDKIKYPNGGHIMHYAVLFNTKEICEYTWNQIKNYIPETKDQIEYLTQKGFTLHNMSSLASKNRLKDLDVKLWVEGTFNEYDVSDKPFGYLFSVFHNLLMIL